MSQIVTTEREKYAAMWALPAYAAHSPGETMVPQFLDMLQPLAGRAEAWRASSVLDAGTGSGKGALALRGAGFSRVTLCDLTDAGLLPEARQFPFHAVSLWDDLRPVVGFHEWVYCCDVMEHIPPAFTMLVARRLLDVSRKGVFFSISLVPDAFGAWIGQSLHQSVQSFTAWRDQLGSVGRVRECRDLLNTGLYLVEPR